MSTHHTSPTRLPIPSEMEPFSESAWIEVVRSMDEVYSELLQYEVVLEHKNTELEESQQFIYSILTSMSDLLVVCDRNGVIEEVNQSLLDFTGKTEQELKGAKLASLFADESGSATAKRMISGLTTEPANDVELLFRTRDGNVAPVTLNFTPRLSSAKRLLGVVITGRPVGELRRAYHKLREAHEELKRTQQQLLQSEKMASLGKLVAGVAHELNNPISFVLGNMHAMQRYAPRLKRYLDAIHDGTAQETLDKLRTELRIDHILDDLDSLLTGSVEGAERTRDIVDGLKRFSAADREENMEFNLAEVIERSVHWVTRATPIKFRVVMNMPKEMPFFGSPGQIQQVITNLVQNASDATEGLPEPLLTITAEIIDDVLCIRFLDNGPGISEQSMGKIFDPFYTTKPVGKGTGLGLSISYGIVEHHGGQLSVSNAEGGGAEFKLCLPRSKRK
jgi:two-component system, NtrC family, sensor histidine kinase HupT/HoxJ